jgi:hypothetical protein
MRWQSCLTPTETTRCAASSTVTLESRCRDHCKTAQSLEPTPRSPSSNATLCCCLLVHLEYDKVIVKNNNTNNQINNHRTMHPSKYFSDTSSHKRNNQRTNDSLNRRHEPAERAQKIRVSDPGEFKLARIASRKMAGLLPIAWTGFQFQSPNKKLSCTAHNLIKTNKKP